MRPPALVQAAAPAELSAALADEVAASLRSALAARGRAVLAVSGGSTPAALYRILADTELDWDRVTVVLVDERWVDPGQAGSNETFVHETLLQGRAAHAVFVGLKTAHAAPTDAAPERAHAVAEALAGAPIDVAVLGLGADGHTASWFPHADGLEAALAADAPLVAAIRAAPSAVTGAHLDRLTLTLPALRDARQSIIMITGPEKRRAYEAALDELNAVADMPVRALLAATGATVSTRWAP